MNIEKEDSKNQHPGCWSVVRSFLQRHIRGRTVLLIGREILFILSIYIFLLLCDLLIRKLYPNEELKKVALQNAYNLVRFETLVGLHYLELFIQHFFVRTLNIAILMKALNVFYLGFHLPISLIFLLHMTCSRESNERSQSSAYSSPSTPLEVIIDSGSGTAIQNSDERISIDRNDINNRPLISNETPLLARKNYPSVRSCLRSSWRRFKELVSLQVTVRDFKRFRWSLLILHVLFAITIVIFPVAPPRMLPEKGYVDTLQFYSRTDITATETRLGVNAYAAFPSLHFAYGLFVGIGYYFFAVKRWLRVVGVIYTITVGFVIVITGNHYFIDAMGALVYCSIAVYASTVIVNYTSRHTWRSVKWVETKSEVLCDKIFGSDTNNDEFMKLEANERSLISQG